MLTAKENFRQTILPGGHPDRFVNQYEAIKTVFHPAAMTNTRPKLGEMNVKNNWGYYMSWPENTPGAFPVHNPPSMITVQDIENWRDYVKAPPTKFPQELWDVAKGMVSKIDGNLAYKAAFIAPGIFEQTHNLCSMDEALLYYMINEDEMHDMVRYLADWELEVAEGICSNLHVDALFHHDDWGSATNSFMRPEMFEDYFLEPYKEIYKYYHDHGVEFIIHHSDSYAANLVPYMIEMGIDVWQGCMESNNVPELVKKYGDQITFMGDIDNKSVDFPDWTDENCAKEARRAMENNGNEHFIPCLISGSVGGVYPGVYTSLTKAINQYNYEKFGFTPEEQEAMRIPVPNV